MAITMRDARAASLWVAALLGANWGGHTAPVWADDAALEALLVDHPHIVAAPDGATTAVGLLKIHNRTAETDSLTAVDGPGVTLMHRVEVGDEMRMVPVDRLAIPRGATVAFSPEALHLVFDDAGAFEIGDLVPTTFVFETAGEMAVIFRVETDGKTGLTGH